MPRTQRTPLQDVLNGFERKYGPRNRAWMHNRHDVLLFLQDAVLQLSKQVRSENTPKKVLLVSLASVFSRTTTLANNFGNLDILGALSKKYPTSGCAYCGIKVCICESNKRNDIREAAIDAMQTEWSIFQWCRLLKRTYGQSNREKGLAYAIGRLEEEILEVSNTEFKAKHNPNVTTSEFREELAKEFADVFAWIFAIANILDVNLDGQIKHWAFGKCPDCNLNPCNCGAFKFTRFK